MAPRVSVVLAVHNGGLLVAESIHSVLSQSFADFELVAIDDGSTDDTLATLLSLRDKDPRLFVVHQENRGLTAALNRGIELARGELVARQDADDVSLPGRFATQVRFLDTHQDVAAVGSSADVVDASGHVVGRLNAECGARAVRRGLRTLRTTPVHGSMMMRREVVRQIGGYRAAFRMAQDYDLWLRLSERHDMDNVPGVYYQWRLGAGSVYSKRRATQLQFAAVARVLDDERAEYGSDSYSALASSENLETFLSDYRLGGRAYALCGELLFRAFGNSTTVRNYFYKARLRKHRSLRVLALSVWAQLRLPWPGGRPLRPPVERKWHLDPQ